MLIPRRTSDKRQRTVVAHEAAGLSSTNMGLVSLFGCGMIRDGGRSDWREIAEASGSLVGDRRIAEARREKGG